jgi:hypothetical protein
MSLLNFDSKDNQTPRNRKSLKLVLGVGALVGVVALGSTLAASINLNGGGPVEFGQGVTQTTSCDSEILVTPYSSFINGDPGAFMLSSLMLSQVDTTDQLDSSEGCAGKSFLIKLYEENGDLINTSYTISVSGSGMFSSSDGNLSAIDEDGTNSSLTLTFNPAEVLASDVYRITIESSSSQAAPAGYEVGDLGPGGGIVFYVAETPFDCGPNLEAVCTYLEAAEGSVDPDRTWTSTDDLDLSVANAVGTAIGTGYRNSIAIANQDGNNASTSAAVLAREYDNGGKTDWYLPSRDELNQMCKWQRGITGPTLTNLTSVCAGGAVNTGTGASGFAGGYYWSSSDFGSSEFQLAWLQDFGVEAGDSTPTEGMKTSSYYVRPVRAF